MMKKTTGLLILFCLTVFNVLSQQHDDKGVFKEYKSGFYEDSILKSIGEVENIHVKPEKYFSINLTNYDLPDSPGQFTGYWHNSPVSQGETGACWCFATISFLESEIYRLTQQKVKLSQMYPVYWEYVERAHRFVKERGNSNFAQGSEAAGVIRMMKMYGAVPLSAYSGKKKEVRFHNHSIMFQEMDNYLKSVEKNNFWNEDSVITTIKSILNSYMGVPPSIININEKKMTPKEYAADVLKLNDYFSFMSTKEKTYNQRAELEEDDNWWHCDEYYNVALDDYMKIIINSVNNGYTICICGDVSEAGYDKYKQVAVIPDFDIPPEYIDEDSRQFRLSNKTTTDDHCVHLIGYMHKDGDYWFLMKDSGSRAFDGKHKGYQYFHEDYVKLKMMNILVHKDAAKEILDRIIK